MREVKKKTRFYLKTKTGKHLIMKIHLSGRGLKTKLMLNNQPA